MKTNYSFRLATVLLTSLCSISFSFAELPKDVTEVLEKNIDASGGRSLIESVQSIRMAGSFSMPAMGMNATAESVQLYPDKVYTSMNMAGMGEFVQAYDGAKGWSNDPMQGFRELTENETNELRRQGNIRESLDYNSIYSSGEKLPDLVEEGKTYHVLKLQSTIAGSEETHFYSADTGLLHRMKMIADMGQMGQLPATMNVVRYETIDGLVIPAGIQVVNPAMTIDIDYSTIELNPKIDSAIFQAPQ